MFIETLKTLILDNWDGIVISLIGASILYGIKKSHAVEEKERTLKEEELKDTLTEQFEEALAKEDEELRGVINSEVESAREIDKHLDESFDTLKLGLLSMQGKQFKKDCRKLLDPDHTITIEEYDQICEDHSAYNALGGNHHGDELFKSVMVKWNDSLKK